jgi:hypothetical protein
MLTVEEEPVVSIPLDSAPVVSVPLEAPDAWLREPVPAAPPAPPRFLSQDEDEREVAEAVQPAIQIEKPAVFSAPVEAPIPAPIPAPLPVAPPPVLAAHIFEPEPSEPVFAPARPKFAELAEEPAYTPLPRDFAPEFTGNVPPPPPLNGYSVQPVAINLSEAGDDEQELDKPAFLRRLLF